MRIPEFRLLPLLLIIVLLCSCNKSKTLYELSPISEGGNYHAIISIPAGSSELYQYDPEAAVFKVKKVDGNEEFVPYLPFPVNYGFIPSTYSDLEEKDINSPLYVFIVSRNYSKTTLIDILPLGSAVFEDRHGQEVIVPVTVPADNQFRTLSVIDFDSFSQFPDAMKSIESFYRNWHKDDLLKFIEWKDDDWTMSYIERRTDYERVTFRTKD